MRIHYRRRRFIPREEAAQYKHNQQIKSLEVRLIDEEGKFLGVMPTSQAVALAEEKGFDLVEVSPKEQPPVCKLLDFGAFKYQKDKEFKQQKAHAKKVEVKGIRLSVKIGEHDVENRENQALKFLEEGQKIKIEIILRGREKAHADIALAKVQEFMNRLGKKYELYTEQAPKNQGGNVSAIIGRKS
jgi:translation initiation factor IF-3